MAEESFEDKTEEPTQHRREELRKSGDVLQSRELVAALLLLAATGALYGTARAAYAGFGSMFEVTFAEMVRLGTSDSFSVPTVISMAKFAMRVFAMIVFPVAGAAFVMALISTVAQTGIVWTGKALEADLERIDPIKGFGRVFSIDSLFEMLKAFFKFAAVGAAVAPFTWRWIKNSTYLFDADPRGLVASAGHGIIRILFAAAMAMLALAGVDYLFKRFRYEQRIKMTKEELKQERKQLEGNPHIRARIRSLQRQVASRKMIQEVKKADVVVTNPTHFAVALVYDRENMFAPKVVAKGVDHMAERIKKAAREAGVPCVENPPLARAMYKALKIGQFISRDLYNAVAEVLAYVYRLKGRNL